MDILDFKEFFVGDNDFEYEEKAFGKRIEKAPESVELLRSFREVLSDATTFDAETLETLLKGFVTEKEIKIGQIIHALRVAVTGKGVGFGMFETLELLGKDSCLKRIDRTLAKLPT